MKRYLSARSQRGSILILALWSLGLLTVFALLIGTRVQQKIFLLSRIEKRTRVYDAAEAGIRKAVALLKNQVASEPKVVLKTVLFNSPELFKDAEIGASVLRSAIRLMTDPACPTASWMKKERSMSIPLNERNLLIYSLRQPI